MSTKTLRYKRHDSETYFYDPISDSQVLFPSIDERPVVDLSVIVPAYNEQDRCKIFHPLTSYQSHFMFRSIQLLVVALLIWIMN